jgi:hypothetical protein
MAQQAAAGRGRTQAAAIAFGRLWRSLLQSNLPMPLSEAKRRAVDVQQQSRVRFLSALSCSRLHQSRLRQSRLGQSRLHQSRLHQSRLRQSRLRQSRLGQSRLHKLLPIGRVRTHGALLPRLAWPHVHHHYAHRMASSRGGLKAARSIVRPLACVIVCSGSWNKRNMLYGARCVVVCSCRQLEQTELARRVGLRIGRIGVASRAIRTPWLSVRVGRGIVL